MNNIIEFPMTEFAKSQAMRAGEMLEMLRHMPLADLNQIELVRVESGLVEKASSVMMALSFGFLELALAMRDYKYAQDANQKAEGQA